MFARLLPPWAWGAMALVALAIAFGSGFQVASWKCDAAKTAALEAQQKAFDRQLAKQNDIASQYETRREQARQEGIARETQVRTIYRDVPVRADCAAPDSVRDILAEAVTSANTGQPGG